MFPVGCEWPTDPRPLLNTIVMSQDPTDLPDVPSEPRLRLRVGRVAESLIRKGHPWVFSDSVRETNRPGRVGELAVIYDRKKKFLAIGLYDPDSPIRVRILHQGKACSIDDEWFRGTMETALSARAEMFDEQTNGYRLINGESDHWPGLVLDRYAETCVLKLYSLAWLQRLDLIKSLVIGGVTPERLVLRLSRNIQPAAARDFGRSDGETLFGPAMAETPVFLENGLRFEADVVRGQKTGFFLDQRENRRRIGELAAGRRVLNAFSFSGGFSLYAARGGAVSVTDVDLSQHALESAARNFQLNVSHLPEVAACRHERVQADVFQWLRQTPDRQFDLIVLDPPSLARREAERSGAIQAYRRLVADALHWLARDGILLAASCSAHVDTDEFLEAVRGAARDSGRPFEEMETAENAADHPTTFPEARYLKGIYLKVR